MSAYCFLCGEDNSKKIPVLVRQGDPDDESPRYLCLYHHKTWPDRLIWDEIFRIIDVLIDQARSKTPSTIERQANAKPLRTLNRSPNLVEELGE